MNPSRGIVNGLIVSAVFWIALFAVACPAHAQDRKLTKVLLYSSWIGCQSFDAISTAVALRNPGIIEGNPVMRGPHIYAVKISVNVGLGFWQHAYVRDHPQSKARFAIPVAMASAGCFAGMLNTRTIHNLK